MVLRAKRIFQDSNLNLINGLGEFLTVERLKLSQLWIFLLVLSGKYQLLCEISSEST